ncbi:vacuolar protein sorting-associated protein 60.2-like isoform X2 [Triticum aestivum]|uniref:vacuolar protein sorting-associated protein 60.2-like isoform X2 n=1 Tax=Triticum aestivum TaxID=4565 RepID=UPI001D01C545|nr:vacuolar protein sorting-associated protein 60.2-like isoform X2 [Triticum aestivum]
MRFQVVLVAQLSITVSAELIGLKYLYSTSFPYRYEGQRDILSNQTYNLDQLAFASDRIKDAQHTMTAMKAANTELKGMMKTVRIEDIDSMQDETMDVMDVSSEIQETLGRNYNVPDDIDEEGLICSWLFLDDSNTRRMN